MFRLEDHMKFNTSFNLEKKVSLKVQDCMNKFRESTQLLTVELRHSGERWVLPDGDIVVGISMSRNQLLVVWCKSQGGDLKQSLS